MKSTLLVDIVSAQAARRPVVLAVPLGAGERRLVTPDDPVLGQAVQQALRTGKTLAVSTPGGRCLLRPYLPPLQMFVIGAVHIAQALVPMASLAGYAVTVIDPRRAFGQQERWEGAQIREDYPDEAFSVLGLDARSAVVALTHDPKIDDPGLASALASDAFYVGALGSRRTHAGRRQRLQEQGILPATLDRICGPIGLSIGAVTPAEIAVAILAEVTATLRGSPLARGPEHGPR